MYSLLLSLHSLLRWLLLICLCYAIFRAWYGYRYQTPFGKTDNTVRHWTATIGHLQLVAGMLLYLQSPVVRYFREKGSDAGTDAGFFGWIHICLMLTAIVVLTLGSSLAKRRPDSQAQFRTMLYWYVAALLIILVAIPWPFAPWAHRPYFRSFTF